MGILIAIITAAGAYLLGAIDTGIIVSRLVYHDDVRNHGSGAAGMTNMLRTFGKKAAAMTACGDVLKGFVAVRLAMWLFGVCGLPALWGGYLAAVLAVIGHWKPVYFGFKGGKGVLVAGGGILALNPVLILLLAALGGGGAFAYIKFIKPKQGAKVSADPDDYEFEDEEYENEDVPEQGEQEDQN